MLQTEFNEAVNGFCLITGYRYNQDLFNGIYIRVRQWKISTLQGCLDSVSKQNPLPKNIYGAICSARESVEAGTNLPEWQTMQHDMQGKSLFDLYQNMIAFILKERREKCRELIEKFNNEYWNPFCNLSGPNRSTHQVMGLQIQKFWKEVLSV